MWMLLDPLMEMKVQYVKDPLLQMKVQYVDAISDDQKNAFTMIHFLQWNALGSLGNCYILN
jgi:hypothetical protein